MIFSRNKRVYLDYASSTPASPLAVSVYQKHERLFGNPSSIHKEGLSAKNIFEKAKEEIAEKMRAKKDEIFFCSSGTESNNLAIQGAISFARKNGIAKPHIVSSVIEHEAVLGTIRELESLGVAEVSWVYPDENGIINVKDIRGLLKENTVLISVMFANNEVGSIQPIKEIAKIIRHFKKESHVDIKNKYPLFHTDACQATNHIKLDMETLGVDLLSFNGAKCYAGHGVSVLYIKRDTPLSPVLFSGENKDIVPGTPSLGLSMAMAKVFCESQYMLEKENKRLGSLKKLIIKKIQNSNILKNKVSFTVENGDFCLPNILHMIVSGIKGELVVVEMDHRGVAISSGSACREESSEDSYVVKAIKKDFKTENGNIRVSMGRYTKKSDCLFFVKKLEEVVKKYS